MKVNFSPIFMTAIIKNFNDQKVKYVIFKNYEGLPKANASKDVDIFIAPEDLKTATKIVKTEGEKLGFKLLKETKWDYISYFVFIKNESEEISALKVDLLNLTWRGLSFVDASLMLEKSIKYNDITVPTPGHQSFTMILYYLLYANKLWEKYHTTIKAKYNSDQENFIEISNRAVGEDITAAIIELINTNRLDDLVQLRPRIVKALYKNHRNTVAYIKHYYSQVKYYLKRGKFIVFLGPDGAGKSTIVDSIYELFHDLGISRYKVGHFLPDNIIPPHKLFFAPKKLKQQDYTKPYQAKPVGKLSSIVRLGYYYVAFLIGHFFSVRKSQRRTNTVIYDRYYPDVFIDPKRYRINVSKKLMFNLFRFFPNPDLIVVVLAEPEVILKRKDELTHDKIIELVKEYKDLKSKYKNIVYIDNSGDLKTSIATTLDHMVKAIS